MKRFVVSLPEDLFLALQQAAKKRRTSIASVLREAAEKEVRPPQAWPKSIGMANSGYTDTGRVASEIRAKPRPWR